MAQFACRVFDPLRVLGFACGAGHLDVADMHLAAVNALKLVWLNGFRLVHPAASAGAP